MIGYHRITAGKKPVGAHMMIDERLAKLTERHEALTGHLEILTADVSQLTEDVRALSSQVKELASTVARQSNTMDDLMTGFVALVELAKSHETRIERLEGR
jgi:outer membrane murein-binding lipoprotein Lpp